MTEPERWQANNEAYLAAGLAWLRLRLAALGGDAGEPPPAPAADEAPAEAFAGAAEAAEPPPSVGLRWRSVTTPPTAVPGVTPGVAGRGAPRPGQRRFESAISAAGAALAEAEAADPSPAMVVLAARFGLSPFEQAVLLLCAAMELDTRIPALCSRAQGDPGRPFPTFALALMLFDDPAWDVLSPERPLRYWPLLHIHQPGVQPLVTSALSADERIVSFLKGLDYVDDRLIPYFAPLDPDAVVEEESGLPPSQAAVVDEIARTFDRATLDGSRPVIQLVGTDGASQQLVAARAANHLGLMLCRLPAGFLPTAVGELESLTRLCQRESVLHRLAVFIDTHDIERGGDGPAAAVGRFVGRYGGVLFLGTREVWPGLGRGEVILDVAKPTLDEQARAWAAFLGDEQGAASDVPARLAGQFNLGLGTIHRLARTALAAGSGGRDAGPPLGEQLWRASLAHTRPQLDQLAQRIEPKATWDDLVLPLPDKALLEQVVSQVALRRTVYGSWGFGDKLSRGLGISALFTGDSGTGKTMAAEVIAHRLDLSLYRIDLSSVVSKYIGETEKNLRRLFDAAEDGGAVLFFDEADALFGKRSEVKDSHDRYANIEVDYLLQRMEAYRGLAILATNMKGALDTAFQRRLRFIVSFPYPGLAERKAIWMNIFPRAGVGRAMAPGQPRPRDAAPAAQGVPLGALDYDRLALLNVTGGTIQNIAINAAFLAAREAEPNRRVVGMQHVLAAAQAEFRKLERPFNAADFRWDDPVAVPPAAPAPEPMPSEREAPPPSSAAGPDDAGSAGDRAGPEGRP